EGRFPKKRGLYIGEVIRVEKGGVLLEAVGPIKLGDGVVFDAGRPDSEEQGGRLYEIEMNGYATRAFDPITDGEKATLMLRFGRHDLNLRAIEPGQMLWK